MKNFLSALSILVGLGLANAQQTKPRTAAPPPPKAVKVMAPKKVVEVKKVKVMPAKAVANGVKLKADGTPDKRYKSSQHLKKDGTPDKRFK